MKYEVLMFFAPIPQSPLTIGWWVPVEKGQELENGSLYAEFKPNMTGTFDPSGWRRSRECPKQL